MPAFDAFDPRRMFSSQDFFSNDQRLNDAHLSALHPYGSSEQQDTASARHLSSVFTRRRALVGTEAESMLANVPPTQLVTATESSTSPPGERLKTSPAPPKPQRKRIRPKTPRRLEQCRSNQARYRDRQREFVRRLEAHVKQLQQEVQQHTEQRHILSYGVQTKHNIWSVVVEYFRLLRHGFLVPFRGMSAASPETEPHDQEYFLRAVMADDVGVGELKGVDALIEQWKRYSSYFGGLRLEFKRMTRQPLGDMIATAALGLTISEATLQYVFPHLLVPGVGQSSAMEAAGRYATLHSRLLGQRLECHCSMRFMWNDSTGRVVRLDSTIGLVSPLLRVLGSLEDVSYVLGEARITPGYLIGEVLI